MQRLAMAALALVLLLGAATAAAAPGKGKAGGKQDRAAAGKPGKGATGKPTGPSASQHTTAGDGVGLEPAANGLTNLAETVPVNIVYVGIEPADATAFTGAVGAELPGSYRPIMRYPAFYGEESALGIEYTYDYTHVFADEAWEIAFFDELDALKVAQSTVDGNDRSLFQQQYNDQQSNVRDVGTNYFIDAPSVEQYLIEHGAALGVDTREPTIFYVDWYRAGVDPDIADFVDHTYVKFGEPDPETGYDFGLNRQSRKINAWGGTPPDDPQDGYGGDAQRVWFNDVSAGPQSWGENWNVDDADLDGDGDGDGTVEPDYRIPPSWEYVGASMTYDHPGYGPASLATDLGKVTRWVGLHLLFTTSPLYPPYFNANDLPETVQLDVNTVEGWNQIDASPGWIDEDLFLAAERQLPDRVQHRADGRLPGRQVRRRLEPLLQADGLREELLQRPAVLRPVRRRLEPVPARGEEPGNVARRQRRLRGEPRQLRDRGETEGDRVPRLRRRQLAERHAERRVQLRLPRGRRARVRPDHDDDPRVRSSLVDEPSARRVGR